MPTDIDTDIQNPYEQYVSTSSTLGKILDGPAKFIREKIVLPLRIKERPVYYHRKFERVPTIDQCQTDDVICRYEADAQFHRDKKVDKQKVTILKRKMVQCFHYWGDSKMEKCEKLKEEYDDTLNNFFVKYGEIGKHQDVLDAYMKQKHRMIWVRRRREQGDHTASYTD